MRARGAGPHLYAYDTEEPFRDSALSLPTPDEMSRFWLQQAVLRLANGQRREEPFQRTSASSGAFQR